MVVGAVAVLLGQQLMRPTVSIDPISVPEALTKSGYTDQVAAARLRDAVRHAIDQAATAKQGARSRCTQSRRILLFPSSASPSMPSRRSPARCSDRGDGTSFPENSWSGISAFGCGSA